MHRLLVRQPALAKQEGSNSPRAWLSYELISDQPCVAEVHLRLTQVIFPRLRAKVNGLTLNGYSSDLEWMQVDPIGSNLAFNR